jgi:hypothetical protein
MGNCSIATAEQNLEDSFFRETEKDKQVERQGGREREKATVRETGR